MQGILKGQFSEILSKEAFEEMLIPQSDVSMALGFFIEGEGENVTFTHDGCNTGFLSDMTFYKENGKGIIVMINSFQSK